MSTQPTALTVAPVQPSALAAPRPNVNLALAPQSLDEAWRLSEALAKSSLVPESYRQQPANVLVAISMSHDLGINVMQAMREIYVVDGKPTASAALKVALVLQSGVCEQWEVVEATAEKCTIVTKRRGKKQASMTYTMAEAKASGLDQSSRGTKDTWKKFPQLMLRHRVESWLADQEYPDVVRGLKSTDEVESVVDAGAGSTAVIPTNTTAVAIPTTTAAPSSSTTSTLAPVPAHDPLTGEVVDEKPTLISHGKPVDAAAKDEAVKAAGGITSNEMANVPPPPVDVPAENDAAIDELLAKVKGATTDAVVDLLRPQVDGLCPKGHPRRKEVGDVFTAKRAELRGR